ncbi:MAG: metalloregulator ArsR/SmtB family transcription factor [Pirellulales bacterium]|nr:metalloregulator ArsR/SmtB family transcription factor [Pirellulales bacterium]
MPRVTVNTTPPRIPPHDLDVIWKALADATRRAILDCLRDGPKTTTDIVARFPELSRFGVMKHMQVLRDAGLLLVREEGRVRMNSLNAVPIRLIYERWVGKYAEFWSDALLDIKQAAEREAAAAKPPPTRRK